MLFSATMLTLLLAFTLFSSHFMITIAAADSSGLVLRSQSAIPAQQIFSSRFSAGHWGACIIKSTNGIIFWGSVDRTGPDTAVPITIPSPQSATRLVGVGGYGICTWAAGGSSGGGGGGTSSAACACVDTGYLTFQCSTLTGSAVAVAHGQDPFYISLSPLGTATVVGGSGSYKPPGPVPLGRISAIVAGWHHFCALSPTGAVTCATTTPTDGEQLVPSPMPGVVALAARSTGTCSLNSTGFVKCWWKTSGDNACTGIAEPPVDVQGSTVSIAAGQCRACAINATGFVKCWGRLDDITILPPGLQGDAVSIEMGAGYACAVRASTAGVICWLYIASTNPGIKFVNATLSVPPAAAYGSFCDLVKTATLQWSPPTVCIQQSATATVTSSATPTLTASESPSSDPTQTKTSTITASSSSTPSTGSSLTSSSSLIPSLSSSSSPTATTSTTPTPTPSSSSTPSMGSSLTSSSSPTPSMGSSLTSSSSLIPPSPSASSSLNNPDASLTPTSTPNLAATVSLTATRSMSPTPTLNSNSGGNGGSGIASGGTLLAPGAVAGISIAGILAGAVILVTGIFVLSRYRKRMPQRHPELSSHPIFAVKNPLAVPQVVTAPAVDSPPSPASQWFRVEDNGDVFYRNALSGELLWTLPVGAILVPDTGLPNVANAPQIVALPAATLPQGWSRVSDDEGDVWFQGPNGETSWDPPAM